MQPPLCTGIHSRRPGRTRRYQRRNVSDSGLVVPRNGKAQRGQTLGLHTSIAPKFRALDAVCKHQLVLLVQRNGAAVSRHDQKAWGSFPSPKTVFACHPVRFHCSCHTNR